MHASVFADRSCFVGYLLGGGTDFPSAVHFTGIISQISYSYIVSPENASDRSHE